MTALLNPAAGSQPMLFEKSNAALVTDSSFKLLVVDTASLAILDSHFTMTEISNLNVSSVVDLSKNRQKSEGVEAIYLIQPSLASVSALIADFKGI